MDFSAKRDYLLRRVARKSIFVYCLVLLLIFLAPQSVALRVEAQSTRWSTPEKIPGYEAETWPPILIADHNRTVHAFSTQWTKAEQGESLRAIFYNRWSLEQGWTAPTDIILSPEKEARITDAYLDGSGTFHVAFWGGDNNGAAIYYSKAAAPEAGNARAWSTPIIIGADAGDPEGAVFIEDDQGTLYVIYNGRELGNGLYITNSKDRGENWSDPFPIFLTQNDEPNISQLQVTKGKSGWLHAIWGVFNENSQGRGIYYARSMDGNEWSEPVLLADAQEGLGTWTPAIIEYKDTLIALYNLSARIFMRCSIDNGETWGDPSIIFPRHVGVNGEMALVVDSSNDLHLFFGQRIPGIPDIHGMWHSIYKDGRWVEPEAVVKGALIQDPDGDKGFGPHTARATVSQGNTLLVTWRTDPNAGPNGVWYSYKTIDAPVPPVTELPSSIRPDSGQSKIADTPIDATLPPVSLPTSISENNQALEVPVDGSLIQNRPAIVLLAGFTSAIILLSILAISRISNRRK